MIEANRIARFLDRSLPAILIGGPPQSGKSTLTHALDQALQEQRIEAYTLRASPDGEGAWSYAVEVASLRRLRSRARGAWTPELAQRLAADVKQRHLPLLVDVGGRVSPETALIARQCTHAIFLAANLDDLDDWRALAVACNLEIVADLQSVRDQPDTIIEQFPYLRGTISDLQRTSLPKGICFQALLSRVTDVCRDSPDNLRTYHLARARYDLVLDVTSPIYPLPGHAPEEEPIQPDPPPVLRWQPDELPRLLASLPSGTPLSLYGRGPNWLYAALARFCWPADCTLFDPRLGWVPPAPLTHGTPDPALLVFEQSEVGEWERWAIQIPSTHLSYPDDTPLYAPLVPNRPLLLDGRMPLWLWAGLARYTQAAPVVAVSQPTVGAVVIASSDADQPIGTRLSIKNL